MGCAKQDSTSAATKAQSNTTKVATGAAMPDDQFEEQLRDIVYTDDQKAYDKWPRGYQVFFLIDALEGEVNNGGFNQYFFNSNGVNAEKALIALREVGANDHAKLLAQAIVTEKDQRARKGAIKRDLKSFGESYKDNPLNGLDDQFFKLPSPMVEFRKYRQSHPELFDER
jgi:hypothetical protein